MTRAGREVDADDVACLLETKLLPAGLLHR